MCSLVTILTYLLTYLLTYTMVQSPSWGGNWFAASQEIPHILWNPKVHYRTHKRPPPVPILYQPNPVHIPTSRLLEIHPNIIHPSTPRSRHCGSDLLPGPLGHRGVIGPSDRLTKFIGFCVLVVMFLSSILAGQIFVQLCFAPVQYVQDVTIYTISHFIRYLKSYKNHWKLIHWYLPKKAFEQVDRPVICLPLCFSVPKIHLCFDQ